MLNGGGSNQRELCTFKFLSSQHRRYNFHLEPSVFCLSVRKVFFCNSTGMHAFLIRFLKIVPFSPDVDLHLVCLWYVCVCVRKDVP